MNKEYIDKCVNIWYELLNTTSGLDMDNIRELFRDNSRGNITNNTRDYIDVNYKNILVTFIPIWGVGYDEFGGKAKLNSNFEIYNENGIFCGVYNNLGEEV